ncbi:hypothetical protein TWF696_001785 [Orbilia brochopaga]|uniref:Uncharacterized protein n=1 Tax=Orbilia brochopaga TaxID=3140254 RepID=A0AAV9U5Z9_9PEZI
MAAHQTTSTSTPGFIDPMEAACSRFKDFLDVKRKKPRFTTLKDLETEVKHLERKQTGSSTTFKIGQSVDPIVKFLRRHSDAFDTMVQANPYPAALIWGSLKILLNVSHLMLTQLIGQFTVSSTS